MYFIKTIIYLLFDKMFTLEDLLLLLFKLFVAIYVGLSSALLWFTGVTATTASLVNNAGFANPNDIIETAKSLSSLTPIGFIILILILTVIVLIILDKRLGLSSKEKRELYERVIEEKQKTIDAKNIEILELRNRIKDLER